MFAAGCQLMMAPDEDEHCDSGMMSFLQFCQRNEGTLYGPKMKAKNYTLSGAIVSGGLSCNNYRGP